MAGNDDASLAVQLISGLLSDVDTADAVLSHASANLFRLISNSGIGSLFGSELVKNQLHLLLNSVRVLLRYNGCQMLVGYDGCSDSSSARSSSISDICTDLLDLLCRPILDHVVASGLSSGCGDPLVASVLSLVVSCFSFASCDARTEMFRVLISLLNCTETSFVQLRVVKVLSELYESQDEAFSQSTTDDLVTAIEERCCLTADEPFIGRILVLLVPSVVAHCDHREVAIARLWSMVERCYSNAGDAHISCCCFLICGLVDVFFTPVNVSTSMSINLLCSPVLWNCVQKGLRHSEALTRKRAIFLLRRALDYAGMIESSGDAELTAAEGLSELLNSAACLRQLSSVWREVVVLFEMLEEKQVSFCVCSIAVLLCSSHRRVNPLWAH